MKRAVCADRVVLDARLFLLREDCGTTNQNNQQHRNYESDFSTHGLSSRCALELDQAEFAIRSDTRRFDVARPNARKVVTTPSLPCLQIKLAAHSTFEADAIGFPFMREWPRHLAMPTGPEFGDQKQKRVSALYRTMRSCKRDR
jgi:hypothetical protein